MNEIDTEIILAFADNNMNVMDTARQVYMSRNTVVYHIEKIEQETGRDPRNFYELCELLSMIRGAEDGI